MPFCPICKYEYLPEVDTCPDCGEALVNQLPPEDLRAIDYVHLRDLPSRLYAEMLREALEREGIAAMIKGDDIGIMLGSFSTSSPVAISIWVDRSQLSSAKKVSSEILGDL